jgi:prepilin peptidase CpaA
MFMNAIPLAAVLVGTGAAAAIDLRTHRVPNVLTAWLAGAGFLCAAIGLGRIGLLAAVGGSLVGLLIMLPGYIFGGTGGGDVKLLAAAGAWLGPVGTMRAFIFMTLAGAALAIAVGAYRLYTTGLTDRKFAFAPAIAAGAIVAAVLP